MTIERVEFTNFRCLKSATLRLGPMTVLVGPNATGKSTVLRGVSSDLRLNPADNWQRRSEFAAQRTLHMSDGQAYRSPGMQVSRPREAERPPVCLALHLDVNALRSENLLKQEPALAFNGANLTNVFATLPRRVQAAAAAEFCKLVPVFADVDVRPSEQGRHRLCFLDRWRDDLWYDPADVSDGTMLMFAYSLLQHLTDPPGLLTIEEPEHGLHPYLLAQLVALLRGIAEGTIGRRAIQVVLATHSAELLEHLRPEEVRFLSREADGSVTIEEAPVDDPDWRRVYDEYQRSMGALWLSGNLGGVPRSAA